MAFCIRQISQNSSSSSRPLTQAQQVAEKIDLEPAKLKDYNGHFLYYPTKIRDSAIETIQPKSTEEYLKDFGPALLMNKPEYEKEELIYDASTKIWRLVKVSELYKYSS